jgi:hypothetical protein
LLAPFGWASKIRAMRGFGGTVVLLVVMAMVFLFHVFLRRKGVRRTEAGWEEVRCPHCKRPVRLTPWHPFGKAVSSDPEESPGRRKCGHCGGIYDFN